MIAANINKVFSPTHSPFTINKIIRQTYRGIFSHYFEKLLLAYYGHHKIKHYVKQNIQISGLEKLDHHLNQGKGVILVTGHFGAVEFFPALLPQLGYVMSMMVHFNSPRLKQTLYDLARKEGIGVIDSDEGNILFKALHSLKRNEIMITECDEIDAWDTSTTKKISILGHSMYLDRGIDIIALRSRAPVMTAFIRRLGFFKYKLEIQDLGEFAEAASVSSIQGKLLKVFEKYVYNYPDQWYEWKKFHKMVCTDNRIKTERVQPANPFARNISSPAVMQLVGHEQ